MCLAKNELPSKKKIQLTVNEQLEKKRSNVPSPN